VMSKSAMTRSLFIRTCFLIVSCLHLFVVARRSIGIESVNGLYKSTDLGASWFQVGEGLPPSARISALITADNTILAGTDQGVFVSNNEGLTWCPSQSVIATNARVL